MRFRTRMTAALVGGAVAAMAVAGLALASHPGGYSLFGDAQHVSPGNASARAVQLRSDASPGFGGIDFDVAAGTTFAELDSLSTDYWFEADDSCAGGSPRFQVNVEDPDSDDEGNIFVYIGPPPGYTGCPPSVWLNTGDLLEGINPIDTSQLDGGTFYDPYATALTKYGDYVVTGVQLVVDAGWAFADGEQTARVDNTDIAGHVYTYDEPQSKDDCKKNGWRNLSRDDGSRFKNQGDCIQYVNTGK